MLQRLFAIFLLILFSPVLVLIYSLLKMSTDGSTVFREKRAGKDMNPFVMYKFRTMKMGAEHEQGKLLHLNEADGPVFKIRKDPRHTHIGRWLSHTGLDELPQLFNVLFGNMSFVGPRPLPMNEAEKVPKKYENRFSVKPGITSYWVINGMHEMSFREWMEGDMEYISTRSFLVDIVVLFKTAQYVVSSILSR